MAREQLAMVAAEDGHGFAIDDEDVVSMTMTTSPRRPTFLQRARWDAVQKAKVQGMSIRRMARELGLHRDTVRRYIDAESPPTRRSPANLPASTSDTISEQTGDIFR
jgi:ActR/RegA family two-component response regulator